MRRNTLNCLRWLDPPWLGELSPAEREELDRRTLLDLVHNNTPAAAVHLIVLAAFLYYTSFARDHAAEAVVVSLVMTIFTVLRFWYAKSIRARQAIGASRDHQIFRFICCGHAAVWSWFTYNALGEYKDSWISFLLVLALSGIANGAMTVLAADVRLSSMYSIILAAAAVAWTRQLAPIGNVVGILSILYTLALIVFARQRNHLILDGIRNEMRLEAQTAELRRAKEQAEAAGVAKTQFLAAMSHEIRTPLSGVLGLVNLLNETALDTSQRELTQAIEQSGDLLLTIVNDILDYSKIGAGKLTLESVPFHLRESLCAVIEPMRKVSLKKGIHIGLHLDPALPAWVHGDPTRCKQVLSNLLSNAVKFTQAGEIHVEAARGNRPGMIRFAVRDTGIGISKDVQARLFEEFSQGDQSTARRFGGTGLGLAICHKLVEIMQGRLGVQSVIDQGSVFWFQIPLAAAEAASPAASGSGMARPRRRPLNVLVAEDNPINQRVLLHVLHKLGHHVTVVENGTQAVDAFHRGGLDIILMDCHMPEMDGFEATRAIRRSGADRANLPIIAVTANAFAEDRAECLAAGMDDHVAKPVETTALETVMARVAP